MKYVLIYLLAHAITASACEQPRINAAAIRGAQCAEEHVLRIALRDKFNALREIEPNLRTNINEAIRTAPITELDDLFGLINEMYTEQLADEQQHQ